MEDFPISLSIEISSRDDKQNPPQPSNPPHYGRYQPARPRWEPPPSRAGVNDRTQGWAVRLPWAPPGVLARVAGRREPYPVKVAIPLFRLAYTYPPERGAKGRLSRGLGVA